MEKKLQLSVPRSSISLRRVSCMRQTTLTQSGAPGRVISIQYMDFVEIFNVSLDLSTINVIYFILVGVELPLSTVVRHVVVTLS